MSIRPRPDDGASEPSTVQGLDVEVARWLCGEEAEAGLAALRPYVRDSGELELITRARDLVGTGARARALTAAAVALETARASGWPSAPLRLTRAALEQASRPEVARWRARRFAGADAAVDLCAGIGGDALALAGEVADVVAVDLDEARATLLRHNAHVMSASIRVVVGDARRPPVRDGQVLHADPSRRTAEGRRARRLADYQPPVSALGELARRARGMGITVSPGVDLDDPDLRVDAELEFIQAGSELVEGTVWLGALRQDGARASATLLPGGHHLHRETALEPLPVASPGRWLLEPAPAAVRARLHDRLGAELGAWRLARSRALLTVDRQPPASPWWRAYEVEDVVPARPRTVRQWLRHREDLPLEIATAGIDADPQRWWRQLGRPRRGPGGRRLLLARLDTHAVALLLRAPPPE